MSGVAVGVGLEGNGDALAGGFSFNEDGTCINEFKESLAGVRDRVGTGEMAFSWAGLGCAFFGVADRAHTICNPAVTYFHLFSAGYL